MKYGKRLIALLLSLSCIPLAFGCSKEEEPPTLDGKKIIFIGDSFLFSGKAVLTNKGITQAERTGDTGYFYQICKANGMDVEVTNFTYGGTGLATIYSTYYPVLQDRKFDYVVFSGGRASSNTYKTLSDTLDKYMADFRAANPNVKFLYLVTSGAHNIAVEETFPIDILNNLDELEKKGIADDTVIVISTDHYPYGLDKSSTYGNAKNYLAELYGVNKIDFLTRDNNTLIIWSGCLEDKDIVVDTPVYSLDILPTLSNLFGVEYDSRLLVGRDIFSDAEPLVLWPNGSWRTDKGTYNSSTKTFTPAEGVAEVSDDYVSYISSLVSNKIKFSKSVANFNYYNEIVKLLENADA